MRARGWPSILAIAVLSGVAIACGIYVLMATSQLAEAVVAAIFCVALGQMVIITTMATKNTAFRDDLRELIRDRRANEARHGEALAKANFFETEIAELKRHAAHAEKDFNAAIIATRDDLHDLTRRYEAALANGPAQAVAEAAPEPAGEAAPGREHLSFSLEPLIDLANNATAHYRARFSMMLAAGGEIEYAKLTLNADRGGLRPSLDIHVINQAIPLLRRLRAKHPAMKLLVPIGAATLMSEVTLAEIARCLGASSDVAGGVVFELSHDVLGKLGEAGIAGLATVARMGVTMALTDVSLTGLDLASLRHLGVKFIGLNARSIESGFGVAPTWMEFAAVVRNLQFQIILTDVTNSVQAASAAQVARFVAGPFFAPPRRVKSNVGVSAASDFSAAA